MKPEYIIGFAGQAKCGKSTAADIISRNLFRRGYEILPERFAGPIKEAADTVGFHKGGETDDAYRDFCQFVGEKARNRDRDWWVKLMDLRVLSRRERPILDSSCGRVVVIDDVRYQNEVDWISDRGGIVIFLDAGRNLPDKDGLWRNHHSEDMARLYTADRVAEDDVEFFDSMRTHLGLAEFGVALSAALDCWLVHLEGLSNG